MQGHITQGKGMNTEIVSYKWYIKLTIPSHSLDSSAIKEFLYKGVKLLFTSVRIID